jgi:hypothetical protein
MSGRVHHRHWFCTSGNHLHDMRSQRVFRGIEHGSMRYLRGRLDY